MTSYTLKATEGGTVRLDGGDDKMIASRTLPSVNCCTAACQPRFCVAPGTIAPPTLDFVRRVPCVSIKNSNSTVNTQSL